MQEQLPSAEQVQAVELVAKGRKMVKVELWLQPCSGRGTPRGLRGSSWWLKMLPVDYH